MELNNITNTGTWGQQVTRLNDNFNKVALGIETLQEMYKSLSQGAIEVVDTLPQTGKANKIYRLVGTTSYSDYMYNADDLNTPILMATYNNAIDNTPTANSANLVTSGGVAEEFALGAVYDVSAKNPTAGSNNDGKWESLSALLSDANLNTLIPTAVRKGGMSIKFVQSNDNKYVQYRLMAQSFTIDVTQWQGVDDVPTAGSNNLVKSRGVYPTKEKADSYDFIKNKNLFDKNTAELNKVINRNDGTTSTENTWYTSDYIDATDYDRLYFQGFYVWYNASKEYISGGTNVTPDYAVKPEYGVYIRVSNSIGQGGISLEEYIVSPYKNVFHIDKGWTYSTDLYYKWQQFIHSKLNLIDFDTIEYDKFVRDTTGNIKPQFGWFASDFIEVDETKEYSFYSYHAWYDANKEYISGDNSYDFIPHTPPAGAKYLRVSGMLNRLDFACVVEGDGSAVDPKLLDILKYEENVKIDYHDVEVNDTILKKDGTTASIADYYTTDFIKINPMTRVRGMGIFGANPTYTGICLYDKDKNFIAYDYSTGNLAEVTERTYDNYLNVAYIRVTLVPLPQSYFVYRANLAQKVDAVDCKKEEDLGRFSFQQINRSDVTINNKLLSVTGNCANREGYYTSGYIEIDESTTFESYGLFINSGSVCGYVVYDEQYSAIGHGGSPSVQNLYIPKFNISNAYPGAKYIRFSFAEIDGAYVKFRGNSSGYSRDVERYVQYRLDENDTIKETTIVVKAGGTIGTDCDFTDIQSALDSITGNSADNRYLVLVKNGTYDITGINYLGFKNYVTVRGETRDGVIVHNHPATEDSNVVCFDPAKYGSNIIDYACIEAMTLRIYNGKCCVHIDGSSIKSGGKILIKDCNLINENADSYFARGGVNCGLNGGQTVEVQGCYGNVLIYAHTRVRPNTYLPANHFIIKDCHVNFVGYYDLEDKVSNNERNHFIVENCVCDYVGVGIGTQAQNFTYNSILNEISNSNKINWVYIYGQGTNSHYADWFTKYPVCTSIHRVAENHSGSTIAKGTFVSVVRSSSNGIPSPANAQPAYRYNIVPYSGGELFGVAMEDIVNNECGIIQIEGKILIPNNNYTAGQYITLSNAGVPQAGTKENAIGIVTDADQQYFNGTFVLLKKRDYDWII